MSCVSKQVLPREGLPFQPSDLLVGSGAIRKSRRLPAILMIRGAANVRSEDTASSPCRKTGEDPSNCPLGTATTAYWALQVSGAETGRIDGERLRGCLDQVKKSHRLKSSVTERDLVDREQNPRGRAHSAPLRSRADPVPAPVCPPGLGARHPHRTGDALSASQSAAIAPRPGGERRWTLAAPDPNRAQGNTEIATGSLKSAPGGS